MPKALMPVAGRVMLDWALACLPDDSRVHIVAQADTLAALHARNASCPFRHNPRFLEVAGPTQGAACTVLAAVVGLPPDEPVMVLNADQFFRCEPSLAVVEGDAIRSDLDGFILTFTADHPKWSYAETDERGSVTHVVEKQVLAQHQATVGAYWFRRSKDLLWAIAQMIANNERVNNEFYLAPAANSLIRIGARFQAVPVAEMWGLGTPEDVTAFEAAHA